MVYPFTIGMVSLFIPVGCSCMHAPLEESRISRNAAPSLPSLAIRFKGGMRQCVLSLLGTIRLGACWSKYRHFSRHKRRADALIVLSVPWVDNVWIGRVRVPYGTLTVLGVVHLNKRGTYMYPPALLHARARSVMFHVSRSCLGLDIPLARLGD